MWELGNQEAWALLALRLPVASHLSHPEKWSLPAMRTFTDPCPTFLGFGVYFGEVVDQETGCSFTANTCSHLWGTLGASI